MWHFQQKTDLAVSDGVTYPAQYLSAVTRG
jgi:hypothetical protein